jgi:glycosyltransferase involved in cell wall biosynthesis
MRIIMLLSNGFAPDPRVAAEAQALQQSGHQVTIFAWDRTGGLPATDLYNGVNIIRCQIRTTYSRGPLQIFQFRKFWRAALNYLKQTPADIIHCHDLDTLWPGVKFGRARKIPVIFDAHESYPDMVAHLFPQPVVGLIRKLEGHLVPKTAAVITVGELLAGHFRELQAKQVVVVGNYKKVTAKEPAPAPNPQPLKIIYVGGLNRDRLLGPMIQAVASLDQYRLTIVGDGPERSKLEQLAAGAANVEFTGYLPQEQARGLVETSHLVYYAVDPSFSNNQYSAPNALFIALASGRPLIATGVGEIARIIQHWDCGTVLKDLAPETIRAALTEYLNPEAWQQKSLHSIRAAVTEYNWEKARQNLLNLYQIVGQGKSNESIPAGR